MHLQPGTLLKDRYQIRSLLEEREGVSCWSALDLRLNREVEVRSGSGPSARDAEAQMERRSSALAAQIHPRIQMVLDHAVLEGGAYTISRLVPGQCLADRLVQGRMAWPEARRILDGILELLEAAHARGLPHLHLVPMAVMVGTDGAVLLRHFAQGLSDLPPEGDPHRAPELDRGESGPAADLYACGALIPDLLGPDAGAWPREAVRFHALLCRPDPRQRPVSARAARSLLAMGEAETTAPKRRPWRLALFPVALVGLTAWAVWHHRHGRVRADRLDPEARAIYLQAREHMARRTGEDLQKGEAAFRAVVVREPACAEAWSGLAADQTLLGVHASISREESLSRARESARHALALDPRNGEATAVLAYLSFRFEWDWKAGEAGFREAVALEPDRALIRHWWGFFLSLTGRHQEAIKELTLARRLDPVDRQIPTNLAVARAWAGDVNGGLALLDDLLYHDPNFDSARQRLRMTLESEGRIPEALSAWREMARHGAIPQSLYDQMERGWRKGGARGYLRIRLEQLARIPEGEADPFFEAELHAMLGERDAAFRALKAAVTRHSLFLVWAPQDPCLRGLRQDLRWKDLLRDLHYPES